MNQPNSEAGARDKAILETVAREILAVVKSHGVAATVILARPDVCASLKFWDQDWNSFGPTPITPETVKERITNTLRMTASIKEAATETIEVINKMFAVAGKASCEPLHLKVHSEKGRLETRSDAGGNRHD